MTLKILEPIEPGAKQEDAEALLNRSCDGREFTLLPWGQNSLLRANTDAHLLHKLEDQLLPRALIHGYTLKLELNAETAAARLKEIVPNLNVI